MVNILTHKGFGTLIVLIIALSVLSLSINYLYLEISLLLLLIILFIIALKIEKTIVANIFGILLIGFILYSTLVVLKMEENRLFNLGIIFISIPWIIVFNRYFKLVEEERLPRLEAFFERRNSLEIFGTFISLGFLKVIFDFKILNANITIGKEVLSNLYSINFQLFGIILTGVIMIAVFIARGHGDIVQGKKEQKKKGVLTQGVKGIVLFAIPIIFLPVLGIIANMDLYIGQDMSSFQNTIVTWIFSVTFLMSIFCILFIGMLIYDLLEIKEE